MIDMTTVLADTPGAAERVFLNSAGSSLMPTPVLDEVVGHLRRETEIGGYEALDERRADLEAGYRTFAELLGCRPDQVAFTDSATRSWLAAFDAVPLGAGDRVLVGEVEYGGNAIALLMRARAVGASVEVVPSDADGTFAADALAEMLDERVKLVSVVHIPTNGGMVADVRRISDAAHAAGALVLLDACQAVGQLAVDAEALDVDILTGTGRKWLRGPRGTGFLVVRDRAKAVLRPKAADLQGGIWTGADSYTLRDDVRVYELWENDAAGRLGLIAAARYLQDLGPTAVQQAVTQRGAYLRDALAQVPGVTVRDRAQAVLRPRAADLQGGIWTGADSYTLRDDVRVYELWENDAAGRLGLIAAARYLQNLGLDAVQQAVTQRGAYLRDALAQVPGVTVRDLGAHKSGLVTFSVAGVEPVAVKAALAARNIAVSVTKRSSTFYDMARRGLTDMVRASPHYFVTEAQLDEAVGAVAEIARGAGG